jgi:hypothetical protein
MSAAAVLAESERNTPAYASLPQPAGISTLITEAAKDLVDYQRLTAEGHKFLCHLKPYSLIGAGDHRNAFALQDISFYVQAWKYCIFSRSAIRPGPVGFHPKCFRVCALEAGMSKLANIASQPK